ncbi:hypothetical protein Scep_019344 [Stephania cephalantha]|uniref:Uncharacterized protein n=1 Tax=Stephania cephalantha TaxID=152367 RepID=A0AAP0IB03_9MAGN
MVRRGSAYVRIMEEDDFSWWLLGVYGSSTYYNRDGFWEDLAALRGLCDGIWCVGGDFIVVHYARERSASRGMNVDTNNFNVLINDLGLVEPPLINGKYT